MDTTAPAIESLDTDTLREVDRCDACNARAYVQVTFSGFRSLLFCGHHFAAGEVKLRATALDITDERWKLALSETQRNKVTA